MGQLTISMAIFNSYVMTRVYPVESHDIWWFPRNAAAKPRAQGPSAARALSRGAADTAPLLPGDIGTAGRRDPSGITVHGVQLMVLPLRSSDG